MRRWQRWRIGSGGRGSWIARWGTVDIDTLRAGDIDGVLALQEANQAEYGGTLSARMPRAFFAAALDGMPVIVARRDGRVIGFLVSSPKHPPPEAAVMRAMLHAWPGAEDAYSYGPVCVAAEERGRGWRRRWPPRCARFCRGAEGILFIRSDNTASLTGAREDGHAAGGVFEHNGATMLGAVCTRDETVC